MTLRCLFALSLLCLGTSAQAQDFSFPSPDYVGGWFTTTMPDITMDSPSGVSASDIHSPGNQSTNVANNISVNSNTLKYKVSVQRREVNIDRFISAWSKTDPTSAEAARPVLADALPQIDQIMRQIGLRADNVADAYALWWVAAWEAINQRDAGSSSSMYRAAKQQAENALLRTPEMAYATDAQKQEMAESLLIQAAMIDAHIDAAADNPVQQAALAKAVNQGAKKMGLDLTTMDLTEQGFVSR